jgi:hypothetical protein
MLFYFIFLLIQTDTLTQVYSDKWAGPEAEKSFFAEIMTSNDMIFVVLGVSLIIWFMLLVFLAKNERKLAALEKEIADSN